MDGEDDRLNIEREKLAVERAKLAIERTRLEIEKSKPAAIQHLPIAIAFAGVLVSVTQIWSGYYSQSRNQDLEALKLFLAIRNDFQCPRSCSSLTHPGSHQQGLRQEPISALRRHFPRQREDSLRVC